MVDVEGFKKAMRTWASGVTIITSRSGDTVHGMTASAFSSVSADPPLVLVCTNRESTTYEMIAEGGVFGVSVLARDQEELSNRFAWGDVDTRFDGVETRELSTGSPLIEGALCHLDCKVKSAFEEGSHTIYVGEVVESWSREDGKPLLYFAGGYRDVE